MSTDTSTSTTPRGAPEEESSGLNEEVETETDREPATIVDSGGERQGVAIYLTADDLRRLGIAHDVNAVVPFVLNGAVLIKPAT